MPAGTSSTPSAPPPPSPPWSCSPWPQPRPDAFPTTRPQPPLDHRHHPTAATTRPQSPPLGDRHPYTFGYGTRWMWTYGPGPMDPNPATDPTAKHRSGPALAAYLIFATTRADVNGLVHRLPGRPQGVLRAHGPGRARTGRS
ncbi:hypothetical protein FAIPA1_90147 [Frankia sp. AiPs1]